MAGPMLPSSVSVLNNFIQRSVQSRVEVDETTRRAGQALPNNRMYLQAWGSRALIFRQINSLSSYTEYLSQ